MLLLQHLHLFDPNWQNHWLWAGLFIFELVSSFPLSWNIPSPRQKSWLTLTNIGLLVGMSIISIHTRQQTCIFDQLWWERQIWIEAGICDAFSNDDGRRHRHYATAICYRSHKNILRFLCFWVCLRIWKIKDRKAMLPLASMLLSMLPSNVYCCFFKEMLQKDNLLDSITRRAG